MKTTLQERADYKEKRRNALLRKLVDDLDIACKRNEIVKGALEIVLKNDPKLQQMVDSVRRMN